MASVLVALSIGSSMTTIYKQGEGFALSEPTLVALTNTTVGKEIIAVGNDAKKYLSRAGENVTVTSPISEGIIVEPEIAGTMLKEFLSKVCPRRLIKPKIRALVAVPVGLTAAEKRNFEKVCYSAGISECILIPSIVCAALGVGKDIASDYASLMVGIGGGCTDIALIGQERVINGLSIGIGGQNIDKAIEQQILTSYNLIIDEITAEKLKKEIGSLYINDFNEMKISGQDSTTRETREIVVTAMDIYPAIEHYYAKISESIASLLAVSSPEINGDIAKLGITFVGGDSKIVGIEKYFKTKLNLSVTCFNDAEDIIILGASKLLDEPSTLKHLLINL